MDVLILADGDAPTRAELDAAWPGWADTIGRVVAADGGARHAVALGVAIDRWVGDGDSLGPAELAELAAAGVSIALSPADKDESDTELAIRTALDDDPSAIVIVGALGGPRIDHALANVGLLGLPSLVGRRVALLDARSRIRLVQAPGGDGSAVGASLAGSPGSLVSLLPFGADVAGVTTRGLVYPLAEERLPVGTTRGLSNVVAAQGATVTVRSGRLLVIESPATLRP
jgi:thiamine pyrophosphokinase